MMFSASTSVELSQVRRYLERRGWKLLPSGKSSFDLFRLGEKAKAVEVLLPREGLSKTPDRWISAAVRTLSQLRDLPEDVLISEIQAELADVVRSIVPDSLVERDSLKLGLAQEFVRRLHGLLAASATTELNPSPHYARLLKDATLFANECRFGHTFKGSFGFVVESPIPPQDNDQLPGIAPATPFQRRVLERLAHGITTVPMALARGSTNAISESFSQGLSANMCDELVGLIKATKGSGVRFSFELSPEWASSLSQDRLAATSLGPEAAEVLEEAAKTLRDRAAPHPVTLIGQVVALRSRQFPHGSDRKPEDQQVTLAASLPGIGKVEIKARLNAADYLTALEAHKSGRNLGVSGTLVHQRRSWRLQDAHSISLISRTIS